MLAAIDSTYLLGIGAGLLAAFLLGTGDFFVGTVAEKSSVFASTAIAYIFEFFLMGTILLFVGDYGTVTENTKTLGVAVAGNLGFLIFITGLAKGKVSVVAPIAGVLQLFLPLILSVFIDHDTLSLITWVGIAISLIAIIFVSLSKDDEKDKKSIPISILTGVASGLFFSLYLTGVGKVETPMVARLFIFSIPACIVGAIYLSIKRNTVRAVLKHKHIIICSSSGYMIGLWMFDESVSRVSLLISTLLAGLVPVATIVWARLLKNENISKLQYFGFFLAVLGIVAIALGA